MSEPKDIHNAKPVQYAVVQQPIHAPRQMRLVCIGAGITGIAAVYKYKQQLTHTDLVVYEKNSDVGGTWLENRYPGCACDIPAHAYTYSWEGNPEWSRFYVGAEEIHAYFKGCAEKWGCMELIRLSHQVISAIWSESKSHWQLKIKDLVNDVVFDDYCDILLSATGILKYDPLESPHESVLRRHSNWRWPDIKGLSEFAGQKLHSANWDSKVDLANKTVAVIGSGSSAIQIVPKIQPIVSKLLSFIRSRTWITPEFNSNFADQNRETIYTPEEIERFKSDKDHFLQYRKDLANASKTGFPLYYKESDVQEKAFSAFAGLMKERLQGNEEIISHLIPEFPIGCRRLTPGHGYLEALIEPNTAVITKGINSITSNGIRTADGVEYPVDVIVCATGFDVSQRPVFPVIGRYGVDLRDFWEDEPRNYLSVAAPGFPNYFITGGPNSPISNGSLIMGVEAEIDYAYSCLRKMQTESIASMDVKMDAVDDFMEHKDAQMQLMVWTGNCRSWYKNGKVNGPVTGPWCGSTWHFMEALKCPRWEDYDFKYMKRNRFAYLGMGRTWGEINDADMATNLEEPGADQTRAYVAQSEDLLRDNDAAKSSVMTPDHSHYHCRIIVWDVDLKIWTTVSTPEG
ncbi:hypothetical protein VTL71DRAFT_15998 [Oculimacula yallundae]|uniref:Uncharacterized protein n=1 Tax=Oculimacula yallundae TaxID=86028 RepID=A0ABR4CDS1_9HELO